MLGGDAEPQWDPTDPNLLYWIQNDGTGCQLNLLNVASGANVQTWSFASLLPWLGVMYCWTQSEGSPSKDRRYWAFEVEDVNFNELGFFVWDRIANPIVGTYAGPLLTQGRRPDHLSMSPSGNYVVVSWDVYPPRVAAFERNFHNAQVIVPTNGEHSNVAIDANGDDTYVPVDYASSDGSVYRYNLRTGVRTELFPTYLTGTATAMHFSDKAFNQSGWVAMSTYADYSTSGTPPGQSQQWLHKKVFIVQLAGSPKIYQVAMTEQVDVNTRLNTDPNAPYWDEPHASTNLDMTRIVWNSNWALPNDTMDVHTVELPAGAV